nr:nonstructural protein 2 [Psittaciform chaphamaparvovirus 4]
MRNLCLEIECGFMNSNTNVKINPLHAERANIAANAVIAKQAAAARLLMASQALSKCRAETNPYLPGNSGPFGPTRQQLWGPDPCQEQMDELKGATTENAAAVAAAQRSNAPTAQDVQAAPAPQLSDAWVGQPMLDPAIPETEMIVPSPGQDNDWSPTTVLEVMEMLAAALPDEQEEMETGEGGSTSSSQSIWSELDLIFENMIAYQSWDSWKPPIRVRARYQYLPNNAAWIGSWLP